MAELELSQSGSSFSPIATLPPEIHLRILANVPARQVQKCRRLDRYFRSLIDNKKNETLSIGPGITHSLARLEQQVAQYSNPPMDTVDDQGLPTGFLNALIDYVKFHGLALMEISYIQTLSAFALHWSHRRNNIHETDNSDFSKEVALELGHLVLFTHAIIRHYMHHHVPDAQSTLAEIYRNIMDLTNKRNLEVIGCTSAEQMTEWLTLISMPELFSATSFREKYVVPEQPEGHSLLYILPVDRLSSKITVLRMLPVLLGVPRLRWTTLGSWYMSSQWAIDEAKALIESGEPCSNIKRAALLEDLFFHYDPTVGEVCTAPGEDTED